MTCSIDGCTNAVFVKKMGLCQAHYKRLRRHGNPLGGGTPVGEPQRYFREVVLAHEANDCLIWPYSKIKDGYANMWDGARMVRVSRLVCELVHGPAPTPKHEAAHTCGKGHEGCVSPRHMTWKTPAENQADRITHGTSNRGSRHGMSKLSEGQVRQIRSLRGVLSNSQVGEMFGVSATTISTIHSGRVWGHVQ